MDSHGSSTGASGGQDSQGSAPQVQLPALQVQVLHPSSLGRVAPSSQLQPLPLQPPASGVAGLVLALRLASVPALWAPWVSARVPASAAALVVDASSLQDSINAASATSAAARPRAKTLQSVLIMATAFRLAQSCHSAHALPNVSSL